MNIICPTNSIVIVTAPIKRPLFDIDITGIFAWDTSIIARLKRICPKIFSIPFVCMFFSFCCHIYYKSKFSAMRQSLCVHRTQKKLFKGNGQWVVQLDETWKASHIWNSAIWNEGDLTKPGPVSSHRTISLQFPSKYGISVLLSLDMFCCMSTGRMTAKREQKTEQGSTIDHLMMMSERTKPEQKPVSIIMRVWQTSFRYCTAR